MRKIILVISAILLLSSISEVLAAEISLPYNASMVYNVTVNKIEVYNSTTGQWVTVTSTATTFNIASATAANAAVGNMISGVTLPNGTYTRLKWEVSSTFGIKACETGAGRCTNGTGAALATHTFSAVGALTYATASTTTNIIDFTAAGACPANTATVTHTCAAASLAGDTAITSFVIGAGSSAKTVNVIFDLNNVMKHYTANHFGVSPEMIQPGEPSVSITFE
ncbi:MAG: hypothetical protein Q8M34_03115 [Thermodesulfovibrionales bacterium]|nr:hypothetical protein [Thermodesulfovibrionales bacterium]